MASAKNAIGHCERCGFQYPLTKLYAEAQPNKEPLYVCKTCLDPYNVRSDPEQFIGEAEDMSVDDPIFNEDKSSMWAWGPVGNVFPVVSSCKYRWLS